MYENRLKQGMSSSAHKSTLVHDTVFMVEETYHLATYFGYFKDYLMYLVTHIGLKRCLHIP